MNYVKRLCKLMASVVFILTFAILISLTLSLRKSDTPSVFGYSMLIVITDSMEDTIGVNDFIIIKEKDNYKVNDIITFYDSINKSRVRITHRIISLDEKGEYYITQGDKLINDPKYGYNLDYTEKIPHDDVIGKVVFISPLIGKILSNKLLQNKSFIFLSLIILLFIIIIYLSHQLFLILRNKN